MRIQELDPDVVAEALAIPALLEGAPWADDGDAGNSSECGPNAPVPKAGEPGSGACLLIAKGLIYAPQHGVVAFTVPGMAAFIIRQIDSQGLFA